MSTEWLLRKSESDRWDRTYFDCIVKWFNKWTKDQNVQKPFTVFVDGYKKHLTIRPSEYCNKNGMVLPPNLTHCIQPAAVCIKTFEVGMEK